MTPHIRSFRLPVAALAAGCLVVGMAHPASARDEPRGPFAREHTPKGLTQLEDLDRGLVALGTAEGTFLSWRLLASEVSGATETGQAGPAWRVIRDGEEIATVSDVTSYLDPGGHAEARYTVTPVRSGVAGGRVRRLRSTRTASSTSPSSAPRTGSPRSARRSRTPPTTPRWPTSTGTAATS